MSIRFTRMGTTCESDRIDQFRYPRLAIPGLDIAYFLASPSEFFKERR